MDLERIAPGAPEHPDTGDVWSRLRASRERLAERSIRAFPMPLSGLVVWYRKIELEAYRNVLSTSKEWQAWAQLLIDCCVGFQDIVANEPEINDQGDMVFNEDHLLPDDFDRPVRWDTLAGKLGIEAQTARDMVRDVFVTELDLVDHAQRVDEWLSTASADDRGNLAKGS